MSEKKQDERARTMQNDRQGAQDTPEKELLKNLQQIAADDLNFKWQHYTHVCPFYLHKQMGWKGKKRPQE